MLLFLYLFLFIVECILNLSDCIMYFVLYRGLTDIEVYFWSSCIFDQSVFLIEDSWLRMLIQWILKLGFPLVNSRSSIGNFVPNEPLEYPWSRMLIWWIVKLGFPSGEFSIFY